MLRMTMRCIWRLGLVRGFDVPIVFLDRMVVRATVGGLVYTMPSYQEESMCGRKEDREIGLGCAGGGSRSTVTGGGKGGCAAAVQRLDRMQRWAMAAATDRRREDQTSGGDV